MKSKTDIKINNKNFYVNYVKILVFMTIYFDNLKDICEIIQI